MTPTTNHHFPVHHLSPKREFQNSRCVALVSTDKAVLLWYVNSIIDLLESPLRPKLPFAARLTNGCHAWRFHLILGNQFFLRREWA